MQVQPAQAARARRLFTIPAPSWPVLDGSPLWAAIQAFPLLAMTLHVVTKYWQTHPALGWSLVAFTALVWAPELRRRRLRTWWFAYVAGIFLYTLLRALADETAIPLQTGYAIEFDRILFFGTVPTVWLQDHLFSPREISLLDLSAVLIHWSFFLAPHAAAIIIFLWKRELFSRYVMLLVGTMWAGLLLFFVLPTMPPWLAGEFGQLPRAERVMDFVGMEMNPGAYQQLYESLGEPNSVAAMPSIHMAVTFAMYLWSRKHYPRLSRILLAYTIVMGFALVYLAEHYVADVLAGMGCAALCYLAGEWVARRYLDRPRTVPEARPSV